VVAGGNSFPIAGTATAIAVLRWLADENFNNDILRACSERSPASILCECRMSGWLEPATKCELSRRVTVRDAVKDIILLSDCSKPGEWEGQVRYLPLR
jgi:hypothetical protein